MMKKTMLKGEVHETLNHGYLYEQKNSKRH